HDATTAFEAALRHPSAERTAVIVPRRNRVSLGKGTVTAFCAAPKSGAVFVGFDTGAVACFRPERSAVLHLPGNVGGVTALATDDAGRRVVAVYHQYHVQSEMAWFEADADGVFTARHVRMLSVSEHYRLTPLVESHGSALFG